MNLVLRWEGKGIALKARLNNLRIAINCPEPKPGPVMLGPGHRSLVRTCSPRPSGA